MKDKSKIKASPEEKDVEALGFQVGARSPGRESVESVQIIVNKKKNVCVTENNTKTQEARLGKGSFLCVKSRQHKSKLCELFEFIPHI